MKLRTRVILLVLAIASIAIVGASLANAAPVNGAKTKASLATAQVSFKSHRHHVRSARNGGKCDGFQRCRCGTTAARLHGLPYNYKGFNLKQASEWRRAFPRTSFHIGALGVKPHHVLTVIGGSDCHSATVTDDAGTYTRNVCGMTFVSVNADLTTARN